MEGIGEIWSEEISENELLYHWSFEKITDFNKSYRSPWLTKFPCKLITECQIAIVSNISQSVINFFLFLYGCKEQGVPKLTYSASLMEEGYPNKEVIWPKACFDLQTSTKLFEINLAHPILYNCSKYVFKLWVKLNENVAITPSLTNPNIFIDNLEEGKQAASITIAKTINAQHLKELGQDMEYLFNSGDMCDTEIHIGKDVLHVHKLILCARSPVFKTMMEHDCLESASNSINITDYPTLPFTKFLKYLYTGEFEGDTIETVMYLYSLGDKYDVPVLKETCFNMLQSKISFESVDEVANTICDVLQLAEYHGDSKLKNLAVSFIANNFPVVSNKQGWKDLKKNDSELISNILVLVASGLHNQVYKTVNT